MLAARTQVKQPPMVVPLAGPSKQYPSGSHCILRLYLVSAIHAWPLCNIQVQQLPLYCIIVAPWKVQTGESDFDP